MGLTIHYTLRSTTRGPKKARELVAWLRGRALDLPFEQVGDIVEISGSECDYEALDQNNPHRWLLIQAGQYVDRPARGGGTHSYNVAPTHVIAFEARPGPGCPKPDKYYHNIDELRNYLKELGVVSCLEDKKIDVVLFFDDDKLVLIEGRYFWESSERARLLKGKLRDTPLP